MRVAAAAYQAEWHHGPQEKAAKLRAWVAKAAGMGARLLVFPEYAGLEAALIGPPQAVSPQSWLARSEAARPWYEAQLSILAREFGVYILGGSLPAASGQGYVNRAAFVAPSGACAYQDKQILTKWERTQTALVPGAGLAVFETELGRIGVQICYDGEFPLLGHGHACDLLLIPCCTDTPAGDARVRIGAQARALERQCYTVQAPMVGMTPACDFLDVNHGCAGIFCPPDSGFPHDGIVARGEMDGAGWIYGDLNLKELAVLRMQAAVSIPTHWSEQTAQPLGPVTKLI